MIACLVCFLVGLGVGWSYPRAEMISKAYNIGVKNGILCAQEVVIDGVSVDDAHDKYITDHTNLILEGRWKELAEEYEEEEK